MASISASIGKGQSQILLIPNEEYTASLIEIARFFSHNNKPTCYVSLNKLCQPLRDSLTNARIDTDKFFFVDGITKSANPSAKTFKNCVHMSSASALTEMSIAIDRAMATGGYEGFLFDSLSTLLIYNSPDVVAKFAHSLVNKLSGRGVTAVFTALEGDSETKLLKEMSMFVDKVVHIK